MPSLSAYSRICSKVEDYETNKQNKKACWNQIRMRKWRQPPFQLHLLPDPTTVENWVCQHHLPRFIFVNDAAYDWCSMNLSFLRMANLLNVSTFLCTDRFLFTIFVCALYRSWTTFKLLHHFVFLCALILGYAVHTFRTTDPKQVIFCVGWHRTVKGCAAPEAHWEMVK